MIPPEPDGGRQSLHELPPGVRCGTGRRRGHAHAVESPQGPSHAVRTTDGPARAGRFSRIAPREGRGRDRARRRAGGQDPAIHGATEEERLITEVCTSIYCFRRSVLAPALRRLSPENAQGEYYLTDIVEVLYDAGYDVVTMVAPDAMEAAGVNDRAQLSVAEAELRDRTNERWMRRGVSMLDPE